jgi:multisubunit Na+/H+ antiporter MnhF subunit
MVQADMIDTWLFTALVIGILALCVILRGIRAPAPDDRFVAGTVAVVLLSMTALTLSIGLGMVVILDMMIVCAIIGFGILIAKGKLPEAGQP